MNILDVLRARIISAFPGITEEELAQRLSIVEKLLENIRD